jgi:hypothetical protein
MEEGRKTRGGGAHCEAEVVAMADPNPAGWRGKGVVVAVLELEQEGNGAATSAF